MDDNLDLSVFEPNPETVDIVYKYHVSDNKYIVYIKKIDNILPHDRFEIDFNSKYIRIKYPDKIDKNVYDVFVKNQKSLHIIYLILTQLFIDKNANIYFINSMFYRMIEILSTMPKKELLVSKERFVKICTWPSYYYRNAVKAFNKLIMAFF